MRSSMSFIQLDKSLSILEFIDAWGVGVRLSAKWRERFHRKIIISILLSKVPSGGSWLRTVIRERNSHLR